MINPDTNELIDIIPESFTALRDRCLQQDPAWRVNANELFEWLDKIDADCAKRMDNDGWIVFGRPS